jgi:hypothetical protein
MSRRDPGRLEPEVKPAAVVPPVGTRGVLCVKCEHLNPITLDECETCRAHLWVNCHECGVKNRRVNVRCDECHRRLHKGRSSRSGSRSRQAGFNWWIIGMVVGGIVFAIVLLFVISGLELPRLW